MIKFPENRKLVFVDIEANNDDFIQNILQISCIKYDSNTKEFEESNWYIKPRLKPRLTAHIKKMLRDNLKNYKNGIWEVIALKKFFEFAKNSVLVCFSEWDYNHLNRRLNLLLGEKYKIKDFINIQDEICNLLSLESSAISLRSIAIFLGIDVDDKKLHDSIYDAYLTKEIFFKAALDINAINKAKTLFHFIKLIQIKEQQFKKRNELIDDSNNKNDNFIYVEFLSDKNEKLKRKNLENIKLLFFIPNKNNYSIEDFKCLNFKNQNVDNLNDFLNKYLEIIRNKIVITSNQYMIKLLNQKISKFLKIDYIQDCIKYSNSEDDELLLKYYDDHNFFEDKRNAIKNSANLKESEYQLFLEQIIRTRFKLKQLAIWNNSQLNNISKLIDKKKRELYFESINKEINEKDPVLLSVNCLDSLDSNDLYIWYEISIITFNNNFDIDCIKKINIDFDKCNLRKCLLDFIGYLLNKKIYVTYDNLDMFNKLKDLIYENFGLTILNNFNVLKDVSSFYNKNQDIINPYLLKYENLNTQEYKIALTLKWLYNNDNDYNNLTKKENFKNDHLFTNANNNNCIYMNINEITMTGEREETNFKIDIDSFIFSSNECFDNFNIENTIKDKHRFNGNIMDVDDFLVNLISKINDKNIIIPYGAKTKFNNFTKIVDDILSYKLNNTLIIKTINKYI